MKNYWLDKKTNKSVWDFNTALGDTIKEKYESLYVKIIEINYIDLSSYSSKGGRYLKRKEE